MRGTGRLCPMKTMIRWMFAAALYLFGAAVLAQSLDLYSGEVPIVDETPEAREAALEQILGQVLVRVSGRADVVSRPAASQVLKAAGSLVQQFRYRTEPGGAEPDSPPQKYLQARFNAAALRRVMARHDLPVWLGDRPRVLLWVAVEENGARHLFRVAENARVRELLLQRARMRGVPVQLPLLDLQDQAAVTAADIWAGYAPAIRKASARYPHDVVLTGKLRRQATGYWSADWGLWRDQGVVDLHTEGADPGVAISAAIDLVQDRLAERPSVPQGGSGDMTRVSVEGVRDLAAYAELMRILGELAVIGAIHVTKAEADRLLLDVQLAGGPEVLARLLASQAKLRELPGSRQTISSGGQLESDESSLDQAELYYLLVEAGTAG